MQPSHDTTCTRLYLMSVWCCRLLVFLPPPSRVFFCAGGRWVVSCWFNCGFKTNKLHRVHIKETFTNQTTRSKKEENKNGEGVGNDERDVYLKVCVGICTRVLVGLFLLLGPEVCSWRSAAADQRCLLSTRCPFHRHSHTAVPTHTTIDRSATHRTRTPVPDVYSRCTLHVDTRSHTDDCASYSGDGTLTRPCTGEAPTSATSNRQKRTLEQHEGDRYEKGAVVGSGAVYR